MKAIKTKAKTNFIFRTALTRSFYPDSVYLLVFFSRHLLPASFLYLRRTRGRNAIPTLLPGFTGFLPSITWVHGVLLGFTEFLTCFTGFYRVLPGFTGFYWVLLGLTGFYWVLLGFTGFYWVLPSFCPVLPGFTGFYWVLPGFTGS